MTAPDKGPRGTIAASWRRVAACGLEPGSDPDIPPLSTDVVEQRREASGLAAIRPHLTEALRSVTDAGQMVVLADADGRVLWREGSGGVRRMADRLGFIGGSAWTEANVGTNAIGTSLVLGEAVQIRGTEHFVESHTRWGCAAAPVVDPWSGRVLGVVDVSGPSRGMHPAELALVEMAARMAGMAVVEERRAALDQLRASAAPLLARLSGHALAVDRDGHVAAAIGAHAPARVALPEGLQGGRIWLPTLGAADAEPLAAGWLLRLDPAESATATRMVLDLTGDPVVQVCGDQGEWSRRLSPRHAEILLALLTAGPSGRTAAELARDLFDDPERVVTVRAEISRLRRIAGSLLLSGPYRVSPSIAATVHRPDDPAALLPASSAPVVLRARAARDI